MRNKKKPEIKLPELTKEQAQLIVDYLNGNYDDSELNFENYCCADDGVRDGYDLAVTVFEKAYGLYVAPEKDEDEEDDE